MEIKLLTSQYIPQILKLEYHSSPEVPYYSRYNQEDFDFIFNKSNACGAVGLFDGDQLIGWGAYRTSWKRHQSEKEVYEVSSVVIDKKYRRQGLGKKVLDKIIYIIKEQGSVRRMFITVSPLNIGALFLYFRRGFIIYDFKKNVYGPDTDRVYLELKGDNL